MQKGWKLATASKELFDAFHGQFCICPPGSHVEISGSRTAQSAFYQEKMCDKALDALFGESESMCFQANIAEAVIDACYGSSLACPAMLKVLPPPLENDDYIALAMQATQDMMT